MKDHNLEKELKEMRQELEQLKSKSWSGRLKQKSRFVQGVVIGLSLTAVVAIAGQITKSYNFTSGSVISSVEVNTNFDDLFAKINDMNTGFIATLSTNQVVTCSTSGVSTEFVQFDQADENDGNFDVGTYTYTTPTTGYYLVGLKVYGSGSPMWYTSNIVINGTGTYYSASNGDTRLIKLSAGDTVKFEVSCDDKKNVSQTAEPAQSYFMLKKIL